MDTTRLSPMMLISFAVIFGWQVFVHQYLYPRHPEWRRPNDPRVAATQPTTAPANVPTTIQVATTTPSAPTTAAIANAPTISAAPTAPPTTPGAPPAVRVVAAATQPTVAVLGADEAFPMLVKVSSAGAGLESVTLKEFKAPPDVTRTKGGPVTTKDHHTDPYVFQEIVDPNLPDTRAMATRSITVNGTEVPLAGVHWILEKQDNRSAT